MSKRLYLLILFAVTLFCGCKNSNPLDSTTKVSFSIPARVLEDVGNNNGKDILVCTQVLRGSKVIIDEKYERTLFFDENNKPYIESVVLEDIPLYTSLVLKMQIFVGEELFAEGQSEKTLFTEGKNTLNLQLKLIPKDDDPDPEDPADPEIELKIIQTSITVEEWEESATFTATEGFDSYNWTCGDQTGTTKEFVVDISKLNVGEYEVTVTATKGTKTDTATSKLIVEALSSTLKINQTEITVGEWQESVTFTATTDFESYEWEVIDTNTKETILSQTTEKNEVVIDISQLPVGKYNVSVTAVKGTKIYSASSSLEVTAFTTELQISQTDVVVEEWEESATFTATEGFESYSWSCGGQTSDTNSFTINVSDLSVGEYEVNLTATKGTKTYTAETSKLIVKEISKPLEISRIILSEDESLSIAKFTATEGFSVFSWSCADQRGYESEFTVDLSKLSVGEHKVNLTATKGTKTYTAEATFKVEAMINFGEITQSEVNIINESKEIINGYEKLIFKASEGFDSYTWRYANETEIGDSIEIDTSVLPLGKYVLQLLAVKNGIEYSAQVEFEIQNKISSNLVLIKDLVISIVNETIVDGTYYSITLSVPAGYDSYKWRCQNLTSDTNTFELIWDDLIDLEGGSPYILVNVIAVKNGVEYSAEITL